MTSFHQRPITIEIIDDEAVVQQPLSAEAGDVVEVRLTRDQALQVAAFLKREFTQPRSVAKPQGTLTGFEAFWSAYPRRDAKVQAQRAWQAVSAELHLDAILQHIDHARTSKQWREGFVPFGSTYLNQRRWEDASREEADPTADVL